MDSECHIKNKVRMLLRCYEVVVFDHTYVCMYIVKRCCKVVVVSVIVFIKNNDKVFYFATVRNFTLFVLIIDLNNIKSEILMARTILSQNFSAPFISKQPSKN